MPSDIPGGGPPDPRLPPPEPGFPSSKVIHADGRCTVYYQRGGTVRSERMPLAVFDADRAGHYKRWKNEP